MQGKQLDKVPEANAGDIIACVKLKERKPATHFATKPIQSVYDPVEYPEAAIAFAIEPKSRQDEEKISVAIHKILEEDPALSFTRDAQTKEFLLAGSGQVHVETIVDKLKKRYNVEVMLHPPKVPYKETITQRAEVQGRHKKTNRRPRPVWRLQVRV
jgi:elongation factor G